MPLATIWTKNCEDAEDKTNTEQAVRAAGPILTILREHLEQKLKSMERPKIDDYNFASWAPLQADKNGQIRTLMDIIQLLTLKD